MVGNNKIVQMRLLSINEISFKMLPGKMPDDINPDSVQLGFSNQVKPDTENNKITLLFGTRYVIESEAVLECVYQFEFTVENLSQFISRKNNTLIVSHIMPHLIDVAVGTMRGILAVKTAGSNFAKFPLPMIDPNQLSATLSNHIGN